MAGLLDRLDYTEPARTAVKAMLDRASELGAHLEAIRLEGSRSPIGIGFALRGPAVVDYWLEPDGQTCMLLHTMHKPPKVTPVSPENFLAAFNKWASPPSPLEASQPPARDGAQNAREVAALFRRS